jgi:phage-related baseplate assembly protein
MEDMRKQAQDRLNKAIQTMDLFNLGRLVDRAELLAALGVQGPQRSELKEAPQ